jgi:hypothetical protein
MIYLPQSVRLFYSAYLLWYELPNEVSHYELLYSLKAMLKIFSVQSDR